MYKVTGKTKTLANGTKANIAVFAYKPYVERILDNGEGRKLNNKLYYQTGCYRADCYVRDKKPTFTGYAVLGEDGEEAVPVHRGSFTDYWFDDMIEAGKGITSE
jgi:hypothetical protein